MVRSPPGSVPPSTLYVVRINDACVKMRQSQIDRLPRVRSSQRPGQRSVVIASTAGEEDPSGGRGPEEAYWLFKVAEWAATDPEHYFLPKEHPEVMRRALRRYGVDERTVASLQSADRLGDTETNLGDTETNLGDTKTNLGAKTFLVRHGDRVQVRMTGRQIDLLHVVKFAAGLSSALPTCREGEEVIVDLGPTDDPDGLRLADEWSSSEPEHYVLPPGEMGRRVRDALRFYGAEETAVQGLRTAQEARLELDAQRHRVKSVVDSIVDTNNWLLDFINQCQPQLIDRIRRSDPRYAAELDARARNVADAVASGTALAVRRT